MKLELKLNVFFLVLLSLPALVRAQGTAFSYQGHMLEKGVAANGGHDFTFTLFNAATTGGQIGPVVPLNNTPVTNAQFNVTLDFGANVFTGNPLWLEISVRPAGVGQFTKMDARVSLLPTPYAIFATTAGSLANGAVTANQLSTGGVAPARGQFLSYDGGNLVWSDPGIAAGNIWSQVGADAVYNAGNVGIGGPAGTSKLTLSGAGPYLTWHDTTTDREAAISSAGGTLYYRVPDAVGNVLTAGYVDSNGMVTRGRLSVEGQADIAPGGSGGTIHFGTPSTETGMTIVGANRADIRFDGLTLKLLAGPGTTPPGKGITIDTQGNVAIGTTTIDTQGNVGIGTTTPAHRLSLIGGPLWTANSWSGALELGNGSAIGWQANPGGQRFGIGQSTGGLYFFRTASDPGTTASPANYDLEITDSGNLSQARDKGGAVKAMIYVNGDGTIARCYNGIADASSGNCGFNITRPIYNNHTMYRIDFGFQVNDRFIAVTPHGSTSVNVGSVFYLDTAGATPNQVDVDTFITDQDYLHSTAGPGFMIVVY